MKKIIEITDNLYKCLREKTQEILNVVNLVSSTKELIQKLRDNRWETLFKLCCYIVKATRLRSVI